MNDRAPPELVRWLETQRELALLMAHDLRNPLAAVLANLNFLELAARPEDTEMLEAVADVKISTDVLLRLVENMVTIARLEPLVVAGATLPATAEGAVDVAAAARAAFERAAPTARSAGIEIELLAPSSAVPARGDPVLVEQLVENLVGNAAQHVRRGQRARLTVTAAPGGGARIALDDDGPAFGPAGHDFTRDGQLEIKKRSDSRYSRGLALYVIWLVARAAGGTVQVSDADRKGHVVITLPR